MSPAATPEEITSFKLDTLSRKIDELAHKVDGLDRTLRGNGTPGLLLRVAEINRDIAELQKQKERASADIISLRIELEQAKKERTELKSYQAELSNKAKGIVIGAGLAGTGVGGTVVYILQSLLGG